VLGISEHTVIRDKGVAQAQLSAPGGAEGVAQAQLTPAEKDAEIRRRIAGGESNAEIAVVLHISPVSVGKVRTAVKKERAAAESAKRAQEHEEMRASKDVERTPVEVAETEALVEEATTNVRKGIETAFGIDQVNVTEELAHVAEAIHGTVEHDRDVMDYAQVCSLWAQIGTDLWVYGARKGMDVSFIARAIDRMKGGEE